ncbi:MAG: GntR family transcriptional regulator [Planctomycetaceae bacterium]|nr:GntR family transcriptional regulator [Planctomycetaceae bacterium]
MVRQSNGCLNRGVVERLQERSAPEKINLRCEKLSDKVVNHIINNISDITFLPGQKINPRDIAGRLGISIMPVRDALERLEQQGWIVRYPQSGTYVRKIDLKEMGEKCQTRAMIESEAVINLVERGVCDDFDRLRRIVVENEYAAAKQDLGYYEKTDISFHRTLVELGCGAHLAEEHAEIMNRLNYNFFVIVWSCEKLKKHEFMDIQKIPISHKTILEAVERKDLISALRLIRTHIGNSVDRYREILKIRSEIDSTIFEVEPVIQEG